MPLSTTSRNAAIAAVAAQATHLSLHSDVPGDLGSFELAGGAPAYARQAVTWTFPSTGLMAAAAPAVFDVPPGQVAFVGMWDAAVSGTFLGFAPTNGGALWAFGRSEASSDLITASAHGLISGDRVILMARPGGTLPAGLSDGALYHVINATLSSFQVALSPLIGPVDISADGDLVWQRVAVDVFSLQGTVTVDSVTFVIGA